LYDVRRLPPAGEQAAAQSLYASHDVGVGMVNGSGVQRGETRDQSHGRNIKRENEEVSEDMRVDIPGIIVLYNFPQFLYTQKKRNPPFNRAPHNSDSQFSPRSCILVISQTADHLESISFSKRHLETGSKRRLVFTRPSSN
jgi:hypothetical protein